MTELERGRLRGLLQLGHDAVELGAGAIQGYHRAVSDLPFDLLEATPGLEAPTRVVRAAHDGIVGLVYGGIHLCNRVARAGTRLLAEVI